MTPRINTDPGLPVPFAPVEIDIVLRDVKPTDKTVVVLTQHGFLFLWGFSRITESLGDTYLSDTTFSRGDNRPKSWTGALMFYAGIDFDDQDRAITVGHAPVTFGTYIGQLSHRQCEILERAYFDNDPTEFHSK